MNINGKSDRAAALAKALEITDTAKAANRDLTRAEIDQVTSITNAVKEWDRKAAESDALMAKLGAAGVAGGSTGSRLQLKGLADRITAGMKSYSSNVSPGVKGLVPAGETIADIPLVNTDPIAGSATLETPPRLTDVLPVVLRPAAVYSFLKQAVIASPGGAAIVAPGDVKPTKKLGVTRVDAALKVIAVLSEPQDKYLLEDESSLRTWVGAELADAIQAEIEDQVITGDGTDDNFTGIANASGIQTQAFVTDPLITLQHGLTKLEALGIAPSFIALAAADWLAIQTTRNSSGAFDVGGPIDTTARTAWGTRVVMVPGLTAGTGYAVGTDTLTLSTDGRGVRVEWGTPGDTFTRNQVVARVEGRFGLDITRPHGIVKMTLEGE